MPLVLFVSLEYYNMKLNKPYYGLLIWFAQFYEMLGRVILYHTTDHMLCYVVLFNITVFIA